MNDNPPSTDDPSGPERGQAERVDGPRDARGRAPSGRPDRRPGAATAPDPIAPPNPDAPKPNPTREPIRSSAAPRALLIEGVEWTAYPSGKGAYGTGHWGLAGVEALHFARAEEPTKPVLEALLASGRFADLYDEELVALFRTARTIVIPEPGTVPVPRRFSLEEGRS